jgi:hypothetical protein
MENNLYASEFVAWLRLDEMIPSEDVEGFDSLKYTMLVIDVFYADGASETYVSNGVWLYNEKETLARPVNANFLCKFHFRDWNFGFPDYEEERGGGCKSQAAGSRN